MDYKKKFVEVIENLFYKVEVFHDHDKIKTLDEKVEDINRLFEKLTNFNEHRKELIGDLELLEKKQEKFLEYEKLENSEIHKIDALMTQRNRVNYRKTELKNKIKEYNKSAVFFNENEKEMPEIVKKINTAEITQTDLKDLITKAEVESEELVTKNHNNSKILELLNKLYIGTIFGFLALIFIFIIISKIFDASMVLPTTVFVLFSVFWATWLYIFRRNLIVDIKNTKRKQTAFIKLLNKNKLKLININKFLKNVYEKYDIKNGIMLKAQFEEYMANKEDTSVFRDVMAETMEVERAISEILDEKGIEKLDYIDEYTAKVAKEGFTKSEIKDLIAKDIRNVSIKIDRLIEEQKNIIRELDLVKENDITEEQILSEIIDTYISDMKEVLSPTEEVKEKKEENEKDA